MVSSSWGCYGTSIGSRRPCVISLSGKSLLYVAIQRPSTLRSLFDGAVSYQHSGPVTVCRHVYWVNVIQTKVPSPTTDRPIILTAMLDIRRVIVRAWRAASRSSFVHFGSVLLASASSSSFILCKLLRHSRCIAMAFSPPLLNASQKTRSDSETSAFNLDSSEARSAAILRIWPTSSGSL